MPLPKHFEEEKDQVQTQTDNSLYEELSDEDLADMESVPDEEPFDPVEEDEDESEDRVTEDEPTFADYEDDEDEEEPRPTQGAGKVDAGPSDEPTTRGGTRKRKQGVALFGSEPKKPKNPSGATKRKEAAAKAAKYQKLPKAPPMVSV